MKTRFSDIKISLLALSAGLVFFSSCSRQLTDLSNSGKLQTAQVIQKSATQQVVVNNALADNSSVVNTNKSENKINNVTNPETNPVRTAAPNHASARIFKNIHTLIAVNKSKLNELKEQIIQKPVVIKTGNTAAYHQMNISGNLRYAIMFFIAALIFGILGWIVPIFGWIAAICAVIGAIFLLLWLFDHM